MRLIDADALEQDGWCMIRTVRINETTLEYQTRKPTDFPTIEPKKGRWNFVGYQMFECTKCGKCYSQNQFKQMKSLMYDPDFPNFCPNCGADMREGD